MKIYFYFDRANQLYFYIILSSGRLWTEVVSQVVYPPGNVETSFGIENE